VLVLWGARDIQLPLEDAFEYARRLRAKLRLVADCGHLVIVERPHAVLDALEELER
jgi:pimeloyl-ACP methyl ester carboxylesterase